MDVHNSSPVWTTREGITIRIADMTNRHLSNTIRYLRRYGATLRQAELDTAWAAYISLRGEMATYYAEQDLAEMEKKSAEEYLIWRMPIFCELLKEAARRGILERYDS